MPTLAVTKHSPQANFGTTFRDWIGSLTTITHGENAHHIKTPLIAQYTITYDSPATNCYGNFNPAKCFEAYLLHFHPSFLGKLENPGPQIKPSGSDSYLIHFYQLHNWYTSRYAIEISHSYLGNMKPSIKINKTSSGSASYLVHSSFNRYVSPISYSIFAWNKELQSYFFRYAQLFGQFTWDRSIIHWQT